MLYLQNGDRIVAIDYVTSFHPLIGNENVPPASWHSDGSLGWPFPALDINTFFSDKIYGSSFIKQHSETVMV